MQKFNVYIKLFGTLSGVGLAFRILTQSNILCTSLINQLHTNSPFTCYVHFMCSSTYWILSKRSDPYIKTFRFSTFSGVTVRLNFTAIKHSLHKCSERILRAKNNNSPFTCHLFSGVSEFMEAKETVANDQSGNFLLSLQQTPFRQNFRDFARSVTMFTMLGLISQNAIKGNRPTAK